MKIATLTLSMLLAASAAAEEIALVPIAQGGGTAETAFGIENVVRREVTATDQGSVMPRDTMVGHIAGAKTLGIDCAPSDPVCLKSLGELASVKMLVVPDIKTYSAGEVLLMISVLDVESGIFTGRSEGRVRLDLALRQKDVRGLVRAALGLQAEAVTTTETTDPTTTGDGALTSTEVMDGGLVEQPSEETDPTGLVILAAGGGAAAIGAIALAVGGGSYGWAIATASSEGAFKERYQQAVTFSTVAMVAGGFGAAMLLVGAGTAAVGGGLFLVGSME